MHVSRVIQGVQLGGGGGGERQLDFAPSHAKLGITYS